MKCLITPKSLLLTATLLLASLGGLPQSQAWSLASQPVEGILVLQNGNILRGKVQQIGKHYHVHMPNGMLQVREQQVDMFCRDLEEAYQRRRAARVATSSDAHLELAAWCLRHDLYANAKVELEDAKKNDPDHPRLAFLNRQLTQSVKLAQRKKQLEVAATKPVPQPKPLDPTELEKAPQWARALFVRQIQPLIVHSCAAGGCHQSGSSPAGSGENFHLNRLAIDGAGHPEATLRNLAATLDQIDWEVADESALLQRAQQAHGSQSATTPLEPHKLQVLQSWVAQMTEAHRKEAELMKLKLLPPINMIASLSKPDLLASNPATQRDGQPADTVRQASYSSADPFDPAAFNDRYAPQPVELEPEPTVDHAAEPTVPHVLVPTE